MTQPARSYTLPAEDTLITDADIEAFKSGRLFHAHDKFGARIKTIKGQRGVEFNVWAPNAERVQLIGSFNGWNKRSHPLENKNDSGVWTAFVPNLEAGTLYKYHVASRFNGFSADKADPFALYAEVPPNTASVVWSLEYEWNDREWLEKRRKQNMAEAPISIYEVHLGSWRRVPDEGNRSLSYRELAPLLADYAVEMGFTHVELMPITEHPFYGSWGYQTTGYFAPTSRFGTPQDFMYFVDYLHQRGVGVILDWVPSHFPTDGHGLGFFDGTHLFEHADPRQGFHPDWGTMIFNYQRHEVKSFLISSAMFWLEKYHLDGLRIDAVASMLYLDYSRSEGQWIPNIYGGRENLEAIEFLRQLNTEVKNREPGALTIAEESTAWPNVCRPPEEGGLGFSMKWDMGWMHDTLRYFKRDPIYRKYHHGELPFRLVYAFSENYVLPLSHDEVVHGKGSLFGMMTGDEWRKYANLRLLYGYMYGQPGKKLLFMGDELAQWPEWNHDSSVEWHALSDPYHRGVQKWLADLNHVMCQEAALHELDFNSEGFEWVDHSDAANSVLSFLRKPRDEHAEIVLAVFNFTPVVQEKYRVGVPSLGYWQEILNSDAPIYGGSGKGNSGGVEAEAEEWHYRPNSILLTLPPLSAVFLKGPKR